MKSCVVDPFASHMSLCYYCFFCAARGGRHTGGWFICSRFSPAPRRVAGPSIFPPKHASVFVVIRYSAAPVGAGCVNARCAAAGAGARLLLISCFFLLFVWFAFFLLCFLVFALVCFALYAFFFLLYGWAEAAWLFSCRVGSLVLCTLGLASAFELALPYIRSTQKKRAPATLCARAMGSSCFVVRACTCNTSD